MHRTPENDAALESLWKYLAIRRPQLAPKIRHSLINAALNLPGEAGRRDEPRDVSRDTAAERDDDR